MNWSVKLAKSLRKDQTLQRHRFIQIICQLAIALSISTMLISSFLIRGFEEKIEEKIFSFWSHIRIQPLSNSSAQFQDKPIQFDLEKLKSDDIQTIRPVANKAVILKYQTNIEGLILKGIPLESSAQYNFTQQKSLPNVENDLAIIPSIYTLDKLNAKIGQSIYINILDSIPKTIQAKVVNSYFTNIEEFDQQIALTDIKNIQSFNQWASNEYSYIELAAHDPSKISTIASQYYQKLQDVNVETVYTLFPQLFDWLALMKRNEVIILIVMLIVAMINIISTMNIFVIEKTKLIGMLKVLGAQNKGLYQMLFIQIARIILVGVLIGNLITLFISAFLHYFKPIKLDPTIYYIDYTPIAFDWKIWLSFNILTIIICLISAWIPIYTIKNISPIKVIEFK